MDEMEYVLDRTEEVDEPQFDLSSFDVFPGDEQTAEPSHDLLFAETEQPEPNYALDAEAELAALKALLAAARAELFADMV